MGRPSKAEREESAAGWMDNAKAARFLADRADRAADTAEQQGNTALATHQRARAIGLRIDATFYHAAAEQTRNG